MTAVKHAVKYSCRCFPVAQPTLLQAVCKWSCSMAKPITLRSASCSQMELKYGQTNNTACRQFAMELRYINFASLLANVACYLQAGLYCNSFLVKDAIWVTTFKPERPPSHLLLSLPVCALMCLLLHPALAITSSFISNHIRASVTSLPVSKAVST
jgi:hypothetical protein